MTLNETAVMKDFKDIELAYDGTNRLESLEIGLTSKCNFRCDYCCAYKEENNVILSAAKAIEIIEALPTLKRVKLSGGEVLIRFEECLKVVRFCSERGIFTQINTNGSLLDSAKIKALEEAGLNVLHFSFNFIDSAKFSAFYNMPEEVFNKVVSAISLSAKSSKIMTVAETIIFKDTEDSVLAVHNFLYNLGVRKHELQCGIPTSEWTQKSLSTPDKLASVLDNLIIHKQSDFSLYISCWGTHLNKDSDGYLLISKHFGKDGVNFGKCIDGKRQLHLHSNGDVLICELGFPVVIGNAFEDPSLLKRIYIDPPKVLTNFIKSHNCIKANKVRKAMENSPIRLYAA